MLVRVSTLTVMPDGTVTNIDVAFGAVAGLSLTAEVREWGLIGPLATTGSPVLLRLTVVDARSTRDRMVAAGAEEVIAAEDLCEPEELERLRGYDGVREEAAAARA